MRKRPLSLFLCAMMFLYFPLELVIRHNRGMPIPWFDFALNVVMPMVLLVGLIRVNRFGWYTLVALISLWGVRDMYEHYASRSPNVGPLIVHLLIYTISMAYFINPRIRHLYFDPKLRWWKTKPRYETHLPFIYQHAGQFHYPVMRNISEGGCYVETPHPLEIGSRLQIDLPLPVPLNLSLIRVEGVVRWASGEKSANKGMGVQFDPPPREQTRAIREFVKRQL